MVTFVRATFVHIKNISGITDPILTKLFETKLLGDLIFLTKILFNPKFSGPKNFWPKNFFGPKKVWTQIFWTHFYPKTKVKIVQLEKTFDFKCSVQTSPRDMVKYIFFVWEGVVNSMAIDE